VIVHFDALGEREFHRGFLLAIFLNKRSFNSCRRIDGGLLNTEQRRRKTKCERVAIDVCSMYLCSTWPASLNVKTAAKLDSIILLEKSTQKQIDWNHLRADPPELQLVPVDLWSIVTYTTMTSLGPVSKHSTFTRFDRYSFQAGWSLRLRLSC
jgi:hypothetical protein